MTTDRRAVCQRYGRNCEPLGRGKCSAANEGVNGSQRRYPFAARKRRGLAYDVELGLERSAYPNILEHQERAEAVGCRREQTAMPDTFRSATECRTVQPAATCSQPCALQANAVRSVKVKRKTRHSEVVSAQPRLPSDKHHVLPTGKCRTLCAGSVVHALRAVRGRFYGFVPDKETKGGFVGFSADSFR